MPGLKLGKDLSIALQPPFETYGSYRDGHVNAAGSKVTKSSQAQATSADLKLVISVLLAFVVGVMVSPRIDTFLDGLRALS